MSKNLMFYVIVASVVFASCRTGNSNLPVNSETGTSDSAKATIFFKEFEHDFGKVVEGEKVAYIFEFENKGASDLVIYSATTTCGCTVPEYSSKPLAPGASGTLEVVFDTSGREGTQTKTITVNSNATIPVTMLTISAEIIRSNN